MAELQGSIQLLPETLSIKILLRTVNDSWLNKVMPTELLMQMMF
jgi:hypothetical protein